MAGKRTIESLERILAEPDKIRLLVAASMAEEAISLVKDGFRSETAPDGTKWAPKRRPDGRKVLSGRTSRLKTHWYHEVTPDGIMVESGVEYSKYHQDPLPRTRLSAEESMRRSLSRGLTQKQLRRQRTFDSSFIGPARLSRPRRAMVPVGHSLPAKWEKAFEEAASDAFATIFGGDGRRTAAVRKALQLDSLVGFKVV